MTFVRAVVILWKIILLLSELYHIAVKSTGTVNREAWELIISLKQKRKRVKTMVEYIDRDSVIRDLEEAEKHKGMGMIVAQTLKQYVKRVPAADVVKAVHAENISDYHPVDEFICSRCGINITGFCRHDPEEGADYEYEIKYCPECGAKIRPMDLEESK